MQLGEPRVPSWCEMHVGHFPFHAPSARRFERALNVGITSPERVSAHVRTRLWKKTRQDLPPQKTRSESAHAGSSFETLLCLNTPWGQLHAQVVPNCPQRQV